MTATSRRSFLKGTAAAAAGGAFLGGPLQGLAARAVGATGNKIVSGYGEPVVTDDQTTGLPLLAVPPGFRYWSFGWTGEPMNDGHPTPNRHDGMAAFPWDPGHGGRNGHPHTDGRVVLVRNHERGYDTEAQGGEPLMGDPRTAYDPTAGGGCTTLVWNTETQTLERSFISINGTAVNCAGGPIGQSWFTCEETTEGVESYGTRRGGFAKAHGYVFEVPASPNQMVKNPQPLRALGRFRHEAISKDDRTGNYFETEDNGEDSGFYRFVGKDGGRANPQAGGTLQMLKVRGEPRKDLTDSYPIFTTFDVEWVDIPQPDPAIGYSFADANGGTYAVTAATMEDAVFGQGYAAGGARFARLEGIWYDAEGGKHYFNSTSGGDAGLGQVWEYDDRTQKLRLVFESDSETELDSPDNITVSPRTGLLLCEDGDADQWLRGLTPQGDVYDFALNNVDLTGLDGYPGEGSTAPEDYRDKEFAGATYSPDGQWLFFNIQTPGISFALTGPWHPGFI